MNLKFNHEVEEIHEAIGCSEEQLRSLIKKFPSVKKSDIHTLEVWEQCVALAFMLECGNGFECAVMAKMYGYDMRWNKFSKVVEFFYNNPCAREFMCDVLKQLDAVDPSRNGEGTACDDAEEKACPDCEEDVCEECPTCDAEAEVAS